MADTSSSGVDTLPPVLLAETAAAEIAETGAAADSTEAGAARPATEIPEAGAATGSSLPPRTKLWVGGLRPDCGEAAFRTLCEQYGAVENVDVKPGYGFVV